MTSAHGAENTHAGVWHVTDRTCNVARIKGKFGGSDGTEVMCSNVQFNNGGQLVLQVSEDKHAVYPTRDLCEAVTLVNWPVGSYGEDCGWEPSTIPVYDLAQWKESDFLDARGYLGHGHWQFDAYNVGEPNARLVDDLDAPGTWKWLTTTQVDALTGVFPVERVWWGGERFWVAPQEVPNEAVELAEADHTLHQIAAGQADPAPVVVDPLHHPARQPIDHEGGRLALFHRAGPQRNQQGLRHAVGPAQRQLGHVALPGPGAPPSWSFDGAGRGC